MIVKEIPKCVICGKDARKTYGSWKKTCSEECAKILKKKTAQENGKKSTGEVVKIKKRTSRVASGNQKQYYCVVCGKEVFKSKWGDIPKTCSKTCLSRRMVESATNSMRNPGLKLQISNTLKKKHRNGELKTNVQKHIKALSKEEQKLCEERRKNNFKKIVKKFQSL